MIRLDQDLYNSNFIYFNNFQINTNRKSLTMKNFLKIVSVYVGAFFFSSARMCGLYLIVIQICLYLYTEYGTSYQNRCFILIAVQIFHYIIHKQPRTNEIRRFLIFLYPLKNSMLTRTIFIYSVTYKVNLFGKEFAHVRNCLGKEKHIYGTNKNIDGFYTKTTQI